MQLTVGAALSHVTNLVVAIQKHSPEVQQVACASGSATDEIEQTVMAGASGLSDDAASGQYSYIWKTDKSWAATRRQLVVRLIDGSEHIAMFQFR
jgi:hypothetical protein